MNEYILGFVYCLIGLIAAVFHYLKKRYVDSTTEINLVDYVMLERKATYSAVISILSSEIMLATVQTGFTLSEMTAVFMTGYSLDSMLNRAAKK